MVNDIDSEEFFEPDYSDDIEPTDDSFNRIGINALNENIACNKDFVKNKIIESMETEKTCSFARNSANNSEPIPINDEIFEGDGFYFTDDDEQNDSDNMEQKLKTALTTKNWSVVGEIFQTVSKNSNLKEQLCFFFADQLRSPTEFLGLLKLLKNKHYESMSLIGSKLIVNSNLCANHKAGVLILNMMVKEEVFFHRLLIKTFSASDVVKSAIDSCVAESQYSLLCDILNKTNFFGYLLPGGEIVITGNVVFFDFTTLFHKFSDYLVTQLDRESDSPITISSTCLILVKIILEEMTLSNGIHNSLVISELLSSKVWLLCEIFIAEKRLEELASMLNLSVKTENLIAWNIHKRKTIVEFLLSFTFKEVDKIFKCATIFLDILHRKGNFPKFKEFDFNLKTLTLFSTMNEEEIKLILTLFVRSVTKHQGSKSDMTNWTLILARKNATSIGYNEANEILSNILTNNFQNLKWKRDVKCYSITQYFVSSTKSRPIVENKTKAGMQNKNHYAIENPTAVFGQEMEKGGYISNKSGFDVPSAVVCRPTYVNTLTSSNSPLGSAHVLPSVVANHPRFSKLLQNKETKIVPPANTSLARNRNNPKVPKKMKSFRPPNSTNHLEIDSIFKQLQIDVSHRLQFYVNGGLLPFHVAKLTLGSLTNEMFHRMPRNGEKIVYDDAAFLMIQSLIDEKVRSMMAHR